MTWKTSQGERVLGPCEAKLFMDFFDLWWLNNDKWDKSCKEWTLAEEPFNSLSEAQKHTVIKEVLTHLINETPGYPDLTAANESCIWSIFQYHLEMDLEHKEEIYGEGILDALKERGCKIRRGNVAGNEVSRREDDEEDSDYDDDDDFWPYMGCQDEQKWDQAIEFLADCILWDRDWQMPEVQNNPDMMRLARIDFDYFKKPRAKAGAGERVEAFNQAIIQKENEEEQAAKIGPARASISGQ